VNELSVKAKAIKVGQWPTHISNTFNKFLDVLIIKFSKQLEWCWDYMFSKSPYTLNQKEFKELKIK
jgi:hypothetical protein